MKDVTLYRKDDGNVWMKIWADRANPTSKELTPEWASIVVYQKFPHDVIDYIMKGTKDEVNAFINDYLP